MKFIICSVVLLMACAPAPAGQRAAKEGPPSVVKTGIEVLRDRGFDILQGKRVGLVTNPTGVDAKLQSTVDILHHADGFKLVALFGPEHGVRGDHAGGEQVESYIDKPTGLPVYSLYGRTRKPSAEMLQGIDVLVYDIQDIGCRSYTYISTMGLAMQAAAEKGIEFVVLDRPNPLGGIKVEGNIVEKGFDSFVSQFAIPYVYGLTCGELARMLNEEGMLRFSDAAPRCKLTVVPMKGWNRKMRFEETGLPWVPTSPHIPSEDSPEYYVATGILGELGVVSEGVGYTIPFHVLAAEWIDQDQLCAKLDSLKLDGVFFRPITFTPFYGTHAGKELHGVQLHITDATKINLTSLQFLFLQIHNQMYPGKNPFVIAGASRCAGFDKVVGTDQIRLLFMKRMMYDDIREYLMKGIDDFRKRSAKYLLY
jgi:uncharacterized protein YbbC (DUF1343 family)